MRTKVAIAAFLREQSRDFKPQSLDARVFREIAAYFEAVDDSALFGSFDAMAEYVAERWQ